MIATRVKHAAPGDSGPDSGLEQAFSNVAHAYVADKAPTLSNYEIGFQIIDRSDEGNKAMGCMAYKVGPNWLYAPVFWIDGELKGHELLYVKNVNQFMPLRENTIDDILDNKPMTLGKPIDRNTRNIGVRPPDMAQVTQAPYKYGSAVEWADGEEEAIAKEAAALPFHKMSPDAAATLKRLEPWAQVACATLGKVAAAGIPQGQASFLLDTIGHGDAKIASALDAWMGRMPSLIRAIGKAYTADEFKAACDKAAAAPIVSRPARGRKKLARHLAHPNTKLAAYRLGDRLPMDLDDDERRSILLGREVIKDAREDGEVSKAYVVPVREQTPTYLFTPDVTGLYEVLQDTGKTRTCVVFRAPVGMIRGGMFATVVAAKGRKRSYLNVYPSKINCTEYLDKKGWDDWYDKLPDAKSIKPGEGKWIVVSSRGDATLPFRVTDKIRRHDGTIRLAVDFDTYTESNTPFLNPHFGEEAVESETRRGNERFKAEPFVILGMQEGSRITSSRGTVYVPEGCKAVSLASQQASLGNSYGWDEGDDDAPIGLSSDVDLALQIRKSASLVFKASAAPGGNWITTDVASLPIDDAVKHLVCTHGLGLDDARGICKLAQDAAATIAGSVEVAIKHADGYPTGDPFLRNVGPDGPPMNFEPYDASRAILGSNVPTNFAREELHPVDSMRPHPSNRDAYAHGGQADDPGPDEHARQFADQAANSGQREVIDTSMMGVLLRTTQPEMMVDRYIKDLSRAVDRIGRILFSLYWHPDEFEERYGKDDMPELEDSLKNNFRSLSDLRLKLKEKSIDADPVATALTASDSDSGEG